MREIMISALKAHYEGVIATCHANIEVYLTNPVGVGEHIDVVETASSEIGKMSEALDNLKTLETFVTKTPRI
jgi:hypothetical protein